MTRLEGALAKVASDLDALGVRWALIGALALAVRAQPRQTTDIDVAILVDDDRQAEEVVRSLLDRGYTFFEQLEQKAGDRLAGMRLWMPASGESGVVVDLLFAFSGVEPEVVAAAGAERLEIFPGLSVPVATTGHLLAMKVFAAEDRRKDLVDIPMLLDVAGERDLAEAREALGLIARRGLHGGERDLVVALSEHLAEHRRDPLRFRRRPPGDGGARER